MSSKSHSRQVFLQELYNRADGDFEVQISMYDIGTDLGLEKDQADAFGQELFIEGLAEMKTLSGGMGITRKGLEALGIDMAPENEVFDFKLESGFTLDDQGKKSVEQLLNKIRDSLDGKVFPFELMEEIVFDLKTIEVQMLSPKPKLSIIKEIFQCMDINLKDLASDDLKLAIQTLIS